MIEIAFDKSPLLGVPVVRIAADHPRKDIATTPYAGIVLFLSRDL